MKKKMFAFMMLLVLVFSLAACGGDSSEPAEEPEQTERTETAEKTPFVGEFVVSADDAVAKIGDENAIFVDCTGTADETVKGAISTTWQFLSRTEGHSPGDEEFAQILSPADLAEKLGALGLDKEKEIFLYDNTNQGWGENGRILWTLRAAGYKNLKMVDGGLAALKAAGAETQSTPSKPVATTVTVDELDMTHIMQTEALHEGLDTFKVVDVRADSEYNGATDYGEAKGGHVKGAVNIQFVDLFNEDGTLRSNDEITGMFKAAGVEQGDKVVTYCTAGIRSAYTQLILEMCGFENTYNYDQSYYRWCTAYPDLVE